MIYLLQHTPCCGIISSCMSALNQVGVGQSKQGLKIDKLEVWVRSKDLLPL
jgi:hypothetical protein